MGCKASKVVPTSADARASNPEPEGSPKQYGMSIEFIMRTQTKHSSDGSGFEFSVESNEQAGDGGNNRNNNVIKDMVVKFNVHIAQIPHPIPTYCYPIPRILPILCIRTLQYVGVYAEGIFRKGIEMHLLDKLIAEIDRTGAAKLTETDCHAYGILLKTWLRRLADPLIPDSKYKLALEFAKFDDDDDNNSPNMKTFSDADSFSYYNMHDGTSDVSEVTTFVDTHLTPVRNLSLKYLIRFLRIFTIEPYVKTNFMDVHNIALVIAPNLMRVKMHNQIDVFVNLQLEISFTKALLRRLCITAAEETLFEALDADMRAELAVPQGKGEACSVLNYYTWESP